MSGFAFVGRYSLLEFGESGKVAFSAQLAEKFDAEPCAVDILVEVNQMRLNAEFLRGCDGRAYSDVGDCGEAASVGESGSGEVYSVWREQTSGILREIKIGGGVANDASEAVALYNVPVRV